MDNIIKGYVDEYLKSEMIKEKDASKRFEYFTSYCIVSQKYSNSFDVMELNIGGGCDCGLDSIAIIVNGAIVNSIEEIDDIIKINKIISDINIIMIQSKTSSNFDGGAIGTFGKGVQDFFDKKPKLMRNKKIKEKYNIIQYVFSKMTYIKNKPSLEMYYVTTGKWVNDNDLCGRIEMIKQDLIALDFFKCINFIPIDADLLRKYYRNIIDENEKIIDFSKKVTLPAIDGIKQSYLGYISLNEYLNLIIDENGKLINNVFYENVRDFYGDNKINNDISNTARTDSEKFLIFNNGITIICKEMKNIGDKFTLTNYQIVNGCQTSHVLYNIKDEIKDNLNIPVKIIQTDIELIINGIVKATNRQNPIGETQLFALNDFNKKLEAYYETFDNKKRLYYERRDKQYNTRADIERARIVSIREQIKAINAMFYEKPHLSSRFYSEILKIHNDLFDINHKLSPYYTSAYTLFKFDCLIRNKTINYDYYKYRYFIICLIKYVICGENNVKLNSNKVDDECRQILEVINNDKKLIKIINLICEAIKKQVGDLKNTENTKSIVLLDGIKKILRKAKISDTKIKSKSKQKVKK